LQVWGGVRTYRTDYTNQLLIATQDFTENCQDPRASIFTTINLLLKGLDEFVAVFLFYDGPIPPTGLFDKFLVGIPYIVDQLQTQTYTELVCILLYGLPGVLSNSFSLRPMQTLVVFMAIATCFAYGRLPTKNYKLTLTSQGATIPSLAGTNGTDLVIANWDNFFSYVTTQKSLLSLLQVDFVWNLIYQPMPTMIPAASARINPAGNLLGVSPSSGDHMWMACTIAWKLPLGDSNAHQMAVDIINGVSTYVQEAYPGVEASKYQPGHVAPPGYHFVFMNDAMADQPVLQGYGDVTYQRLKYIQKKYDSMGVFPQRTNGFKLT
jgi:hypothetical protein